MKAFQAAARKTQQAIGVEAPTHMKGLQMFIANIRNCPTKEQEEKTVQRELAKIRQKFVAENDKMSGYDKKKYVWKLLYAYMLGYEVDIGHLQAVKLCSSPKFSEKTAGYLAISLLLPDNSEYLKLVINCMKNDMQMQNGNEHTAALALNTIANIGGAEFADNLFGDISRMILQPNPRLTPYIKRKACICLLRMLRRDSDTFGPEVWLKRLAALFQERDIGLLTSASGFMLGILEQGASPPQRWAEIIPAVAQCLQNLVQGDCPEHYIYYHVACPWLQTKLLRILQFFPLNVFEHDTVKGINGLLHSILTRPPPQRQPPAPGTSVKKRCKADAERQNRSNAEHSILFEAMNLMIHLGERCDQETMRTASGLLGAFVSSTDPNIRYLGLETMARLATNAHGVHEHLDRYKGLILEKMHEPDISIRRQALNLLYALCRPENWQQIVDELLEVLSSCDTLLREELVLKIAILAEKNAPNAGWYVDVVFRMLETAPDAVGDDVWYRVVQVVTGFDGAGAQDKEGLQRHAANKAFQDLMVQGKMLHETLVKLGAYMIGEFGHLLSQDVPPQAKFEALYRHFPRATAQTKAIIVLACVKLLNANPDILKGNVVPFLQEIQEAQDVELQQRSCELMRLCRDEDMLEHALFPMPPYAESVQRVNPLVQRLKFQTKSRAHTRAQLEEAARSEGGVLKPGSTSRSNNALNNMSPSAADNHMSSRNTGAAGSGSESSSDSEDGPTAPGAEAPGRGGQPAELWQNLCIMPQGRLFSSSHLALEMKHEYTAHLGRLTIMLMNTSNGPIGNIRAAIQETECMRVQQMNQSPSTLGPGEQQPHHVQVMCMRPFMNPLSYQVEYCTSPGSPPIQAQCMLPAVMTKFITPAELQMQQFRQFFEQWSGPRESLVVGRSKVNPNQWPNYISKGFNLFLLPESNPSSAFGAGTLNTGTPHPQSPDKMMTVPCLVRLEYDPQKQLVRLTVRTENSEVTQALSKIVETFLIVPQST